MKSRKKVSFIKDNSRIVIGYFWLKIWLGDNNVLNGIHGMSVFNAIYTRNLTRLMKNLELYFT